MGAVPERVDQDVELWVRWLVAVGLFVALRQPWIRARHVLPTVAGVLFLGRGAGRCIDETSRFLVELDSLTQRVALGSHNHCLVRKDRLVVAVMVNKLISLPDLTALRPLGRVEAATATSAPAFFRNGLRASIHAEARFVRFKCALFGLFERRFTLLYLNALLFLLEPGLTALVHRLIESLWFPHPDWLRRPDGGVVQRRLLRCCSFLGLGAMLRLTSDLSFLEHELFVLLVAGAQLVLVRGVSLVSLLVVREGLTDLESLLLVVLAQLVVRQVLLVCLQLLPDVGVDLLVQLVMFELPMCLLDGRIGRVVLLMLLKVLIQRHQLLDLVVRARLHAQTELRVETEGLMLQARDANGILLAVGVVFQLDRVVLPRMMLGDGTCLTFR